MDTELISSEIINNNKSLSLNSYTFFILILILFFVLFYNDRIEIQNQKYLHKVYNENLYLKKKFTNLINPNHQITQINNKMWIVENLLDTKYFDYLKTQFEDKKFDTKNYYYRKATGINFNQLHKSNDYFGFIELYYSDEILKLLSDVLKKPINRPPLSDNNSCSLLIYSNPGDYIDWHLDYSNYYGDRYVVLLSIVNSNSDNKCCSENYYVYKDDDGKINQFKLKPNNLLIFKGSEIPHKSTEIGVGEKRILLSMTFCDICQEKKNISYEIYEDIKNTILYK
jgi:hypothetical protein